MEITNFLSAESIITFAMTVIIVELWVSFSKELKFIKKIPTKLYTFILSLIHLAIINSQVGLFVATPFGIYLLMCNALIIAVILCSGYDVVTNKITINKQDPINK